MPETREQVFRLALRNRAERLIKLLDLQAPASIVGAEAWLIMKGAMGMGSAAVGPMITDLVWRARNGMAFCVHDDCEGIVDPTKSYPLLCSVHEKEQERLVDEIDDLGDSHA